MAGDESSELSSVSSLSPAPSEDEGDVELKKEKGILKFFHKLPKGTKPSTAPKREPSPPAPKRPPSPPHDYVLADNPDIAFIVMFRSRFNDALPKSLPNFGPQELERDVTESVPGQRVEHFLCAVLGLLLNRKQDVKPGHYNRALEDAISSHKNQCPRAWEDQNPLSGGSTFTTMNPTQRLTLLRTLIIWALAASEVVKGIINKSYKQNRHEDDLNQPLSVQPWGSDSDKRRYYLIEGLDDTAFRVYRESNPQGFIHRTWWSVAGNIEELGALADKLQTADGGPKARKLAQKILAAVPRFEATEEKRRRREYRQQQKERFKRPEPGFSMYEGRTRGKRIKYTYSDDEDFLTDSSGMRRSARNTGTHTPAEVAGPVTTASGRQIKAPSRMTVDSSNNIVTTSPDADNEEVRSKESSLGPTGRPRRSAAVNHGTNGWASTGKKGGKSRRYNSMDDDDDDDEDESELDLGDEEEEDHVPDEETDEEEEFNEDEEMADGDDLGDDGSPRSHIITMKVSPKAAAAAEKNKTRKKRDSAALDLDEYRYNGDSGKSTKPKQQQRSAPTAADDDETDDDVLEREEKSEESISVKPINGKQEEKERQPTPEPSALQQLQQEQEQRQSMSGSPDQPPEQQQQQQPPATPGPLPSTALAFRNSPDKAQQQQKQVVDAAR